MNLKKFFESRSTSIKPSPVRFIWRRERDRTRLILFYCFVGFFFIFGQSAFASKNAKVCATTIAEMKASKSDKLREIVTQMESETGFTNITDSSHIKFRGPDGPEGRILVSFYSTHSTDGSFEFEEGALTVCDKNGNLSISSAPTGKLDVTFTSDCFKIGGFLASLQPARSTFCTGDMPVAVREAMNARATSDRALAGTSPDAAPLSNSMIGSGVAAKGVRR